MSDSPVRGAARGVRRVIGAGIAVLGVIIGLSVGAFSAVIMLAYWDARETGGWQGRTVLILTVLFSLATGYLIYRLGRRIAR